jgi:hypothetical protein
MADDKSTQTQNSSSQADNRGANATAAKSEHKHGKAKVKTVTRVHTHHGSPVDFDNESDALDFVHDARRNDKSANAHLFTSDDVSVQPYSFVDWGEDGEGDE